MITVAAPFARCRLLARLSSIALVIACAPDDDPVTSQATHPGVTNPGPTSPGTTNPGTSNPGTTTDSDPTTGGMSTSGTTGDPEPTREICEKYLGCLAVATPEALPSAQMGFGPNGTCWEGPPESQQQCIDACVAGLESLHELHPDLPQCAECIEDADCPGGERCIDGGECSPPICGDGIVDPDELCDDEECWGCATGPFPCNPFTSAGCERGEQCSLDYWTCVPGNFPPLGDGHLCDPFGNNFCGLGLVCMEPDVISGCPGAGCCTLLCRLDESDPCPNGRTCIDYYGGGTVLGVCALL